MRPTASVAIARSLSALLVFAATGSGQQPSEPLPSSTLPLRLVGVARNTSTDAQSGGFIQCGLPEEQRAARFVAVGERACDVAEVRDVLDDAVIIRNLLTDRLERLTLPKSGSPPAPPVPPPIVTPDETRPDEIPGPLVRPVIADIITVELKKELLLRYMANLPDVLNSAVATPRYATGTSGPPAIEGYEMSRIEAGGIVEQLGLRDGDVLLEFNGQKLNSLAAVAGLLGQADALSGSKMTVLRNGKKFTFVFSVR